MISGEEMIVWVRRIQCRGFYTAHRCGRIDIDVEASFGLLRQSSEKESVQQFAYKGKSDEH